MAVKLEKTRDQIVADRGGPFLESDQGPVRYYADGVEISEAEYEQLRSEQDVDG